MNRVEAVRAGDRAQHGHGPLGELPELLHLGRPELGVVGDVTVGADHHVAGVVRVEVQHPEDLAAPGEGSFSTRLGGTYGAFASTSAAAPSALAEALAAEGWHLDPSYINDLFKKKQYEPIRVLADRLKQLLQHHWVSLYGSILQSCHSPKYFLLLQPAVFCF